VPILGYKFCFLFPYVSISRIRENLFKYFRGCILGAREGGGKTREIWEGGGREGLGNLNLIKDEEREN